MFIDDVYFPLTTTLKTEDRVLSATMTMRPVVGCV